MYYSLYNYSEITITRVQHRLNCLLKLGTYDAQQAELNELEPLLNYLTLQIFFQVYLVSTNSLLTKDNG